MLASHISVYKMAALHKKALVKEHYETGTINKRNMHKVSSVQPECPGCSAKERAEMSRYSRKMKAQIQKK